MTTQTSERQSQEQTTSSDPEVEAAIRLRKSAERSVEFTPVGEDNKISIKPSQVKTLLCTPTKSGQLPENADVFKFLMLCKSQKLNPWTGDCFLVGYDERNNSGQIIGKKFSLITSHQAYLKRADLHPDYRGKRSGVTVEMDGEIKDFDGEVYPIAAVLRGGWCEVEREGRVVERVKVNLSAYEGKKWNRWGTDAAGMICKVAEAKALRHTFPQQFSGMQISTSLSQEDLEDASEHFEGRLESVAEDRKQQEEAAAPDPGEITDEQFEEQEAAANELSLDIETAIVERLNACDTHKACKEVAVALHKTSESELETQFIEQYLAKRKKEISDSRGK